MFKKTLGVRARATEGGLQVMEGDIEYKGPSFGGKTWSWGGLSMGVWQERREKGVAMEKG